jgi:hypothetical protein
MAILRKTLMSLAASLMLAATINAADSRPAKPEKPDLATSVSPDLQKLIDQFTQQRDALIADRSALLEQLKNATADQRKALLDNAEAKNKQLLEAQRSLGKRIRDEMRKLRETHVTPHRAGN